MFRRVIVGGLVAGAALFASLPAASAYVETGAQLEPQPEASACTDSIVPGIIPASYGTRFNVTSSLKRTKNDNGDTVLTVIVRSSGSNRDIDLIKDCAWADLNGNSSYDTGESLWLFAGKGKLVDGLATFAVTVPGATRVCSRVWGGFTHNGGPAYKLSSISCVEAPPPVVLPEAGSVAMLSASAIAATGAALAIRRRRTARLS